MKGEAALEEKLLRTFDCLQSSAVSGRKNRERSKRGEVAKRAFRKFILFHPYAMDGEHAFRMIRDNWAVGMNPLVAWFAWMLVKEFVFRVVMWLWNETGES